MKIAITKQGLLLLGFLSLISCNNSDNKKSEDIIHQTDTATVKNDEATDQTLNNSKAITGAKHLDYQYEPAISIITGNITSESFYGPPGFGENPKTDSKEMVYLLIPEKPINVTASVNEGNDDGNSTVNNVSKIQLISPDNINLADYKNKKIRLTGTFFAPHTGHHHTDILLDVQKIEQL